MCDSGDLGPRLESFVSSLVETGRYDSRDDVLRDGVRLIEDRDKRLAALDAAIGRGIDDAQRGQVKSVDEVANRLIAKYRTMSQSDGT